MNKFKLINNNVGERSYSYNELSEIECVNILSLCEEMGL